MPEHNPVDVRNKINFVLDWADRELDQRRTRWEIAVRTQGSAYREAYDNHIRVLGAQKEWENACVQVGFIVLGAVSVGALAYASTLMQAGAAAGAQVPRITASTLSPSRAIDMELLGQVLTSPNSVVSQNRWDLRPLKEILVNSLEDAVQAAVGPTLDWLRGQGITTAKTSDAIPHPHDYRDAALNNIGKQHLCNVEFIQKLGTSFHNLPLNDLQPGLDRDVEAYIKRHFSVLNSAPELQPPENIDQPALAREIEIGLWAAWCPRNLLWDARHSRQLYYVDADGQKRVALRDTPQGPGKKIAERFNELGITRLAGIGNDFGMLGWYTDSHDGARLLRWARQWRPSMTFATPPVRTFHPIEGVRSGGHILSPQQPADAW